MTSLQGAPNTSGLRDTYIRMKKTPDTRGQEPLVCLTGEPVGKTPGSDCLPPGHLLSVRPWDFHRMCHSFLPPHLIKPCRMRSGQQGSSHSTETPWNQLQSQGNKKSPSLLSAGPACHLLTLRKRCSSTSCSHRRPFSSFSVTFKRAFVHYRQNEGQETSMHGQAST